jgi:hypothetical protein
VTCNTGELRGGTTGRCVVEFKLEVMLLHLERGSSGRRRGALLSSDSAGSARTIRIAHLGQPLLSMISAWPLRGCRSHGRCRFPSLAAITNWTSTEAGCKISAFNHHMGSGAQSMSRLCGGCDPRVARRDGHLGLTSNIALQWTVQPVTSFAKSAKAAPARPATERWR